MKKAISKEKIRIGLMGLTIMTSLAASGCGAASDQTAAEGGVREEAADFYADNRITEMKAADAPMMEEADPASYDGGGDEGSGSILTGGQTTQKQSDKKLIKNVTIHAETLEYEKQLKSIQDNVTKFGGYIESITSSEMDDGDTREAYLVARIPCDKVDQFDETINQATNITYQSENVEDVTLQYVDLSSHKKSLEAEQARLLELMERAETIEDIITIEDRLTDVRYQLESMESQLRTMDNQVSYSTVSLTLTEVEEYEPEKDPTAWEEIQRGFAANVKRVLNGLRSFGIGFVVATPFLAVMLIFGLIIFAIVWMIIKLTARHARKHGQKKNRQENTPDECNALPEDKTEGKNENE